MKYSNLIFLSLLLFFASVSCIKIRSRKKCEGKNCQQSLLETKSNVECVKFTLVGSKISVVNNCENPLEVRGAVIQLESTPVLDSVWGSFDPLNYPSLEMSNYKDSLNVKFDFDLGDWVNTKLLTGQSITLQYYVDGDISFKTMKFFPSGFRPLHTNEVELKIHVPTCPSDVLLKKVKILLLNNGKEAKALEATWGTQVAFVVPNGSEEYVLFTPEFEGYENFYHSSNATVTLDGNKEVNLTLIAKPVPSEIVHLKISGLPEHIPKEKVQIIFQSGSGYMKNVPWEESVKLPLHPCYNVFAKSFYDQGDIKYLSKEIHPKDFGLVQGKPVTITVEFTSKTESRSKPPGWPDYLAHGSVTDNQITESLTERNTDAIFKYAGWGGNGDRGQIVYPVFTKGTLEQAKNVTITTGRQMRAVMVVYTAEMSGGVNTEDLHDFEVLAKHFINLIMLAEKVEGYSTKENPYPGSLILNPDLMGMVQQSKLLSPGGPLDVLSPEINRALKLAICWATKKFDYEGGKYNYEALFKEIRKKHWSDWEVFAPWNEMADNMYDECKKNPEVSMYVPTFQDTFKGWTHATNWVVLTFGPHCTFSWQENLWAINSANWVHRSYTDEELNKQIVTPILNKWKQLGVYDEPYRPHFFTFDKYEQDGMVAIKLGYFWNARDCYNLLRFVKEISIGLENIPVMLWQIPGGHLQMKEGDPDKKNERGSTEPNFFFGDARVGKNLENVKDYIIDYKLDATIYGTSSVKEYLMMDNYDWSTNNLELTVQSHVFAILWGGGQTTSVAKFPQQDGGYLWTHINDYYKNPLPLIKYD